MFKVQTTIDLSAERISDTLCCAFEGGSNYWYRIEKFVRPVNFNNTPKDEVEFRHLSYPLNEGGSLVISNKPVAEEEGELKTATLNIASIQKGLELMAAKYPRHFNDIVNENEDADTGDVLLQLCLWGELVYG